jgi:HAD superfamily hydrolase (TIGR01509 family)
MKAAGVIFDLDGTLLDSMGIWSEIGSKFIKSLGLEPKSSLREDTRELSLLQAAEYLKASYSLNEHTDTIMVSINELISDYYHYILQPKEGAKELLEYLKTNEIPLCVATATASHLVEPALERINMRHYFGSIHSCVDIGKGKDDPEIFYRALNALGTPLDSTWVFEDALYAAKTAKDAGFTVVGVHDLSALHHQEELKAISDYYIENLTQGKELFE